MIAIIDYGVGNLFSLSRSFEFIGADCVISSNKDDLLNASHIVLPGVGAFGDAAEKLIATGLVPVLDECVKNGKPLLGICLGMQLLFEKSYEYGVHKGLGYLKGDICPLQDDFSANGISLKVPHIGWNALAIGKKDNSLMKYTHEGDFVYFVHSYYAKNCLDSLVAKAEYGVDIPAVVASQNVYGCQFHPEKSGKTGLQILRAFTEI